jgi:hypothetical protein
VAIDDILVHEGKCFTDYSLCTFEDSSLCYYSSDPANATFQWEVGTGVDQPAGITGPSVDVLFP